MPSSPPTLHMRYGAPGAPDQTMQDWPSSTRTALCHWPLGAQHPIVPLELRHEHYAGADTGLHCHVDFLALYVVREGGGVHCIDGRSYPLARGDVYLMPAGATHEYRDHHNLAIDACYFTTELFNEAELESLRELPGFWRLFAGEGEAVHHWRPRSPQWKVVLDALAELDQEWTEGSRSGPLLLRSGFYRLLVHLARSREGAEAARGNGAKRGPGAVHRTEPGIEAILRFCEANFGAPLSVPQLAARLFLTPGHFSEKFAREVGVPPKTYLRRLRVEKARQLLLETELSTTQIALRTGFGDAAHFSRAFRAATGEAPSLFRKRGMDGSRNGAKNHQVRHG